MDERLAEVARDSAPRALATLLRRSGDFAAAEDAVQEALLAATRQWPEQGVPDNPDAWLVTVASRRLVDAWRSEASRTDREARVAAEDVRLRPDAADDPAARAGAPDEQLTLMLLCCHPALSRPSQVALTLRAVGGLTTAQIARAFLVPEATLAQRISRAKATLRESGARFALPAPEELPARVVAVTEVLYLAFTEGHTTTRGEGLVNISLTREAIRLTRLLHARLPAADEVTGLLALMLLTEARRPARLDATGALVPLAAQDRSRWDATMAAEGIQLVEGVLAQGPVGSYQLQAAIAAVHTEAATADATDWPQIVMLYDMLSALAPGPMVSLNRAVAVAHVDGPDAALALVDGLADDPALKGSHRVPAVRAHLLAMAGRDAEARTCFASAARLATSHPEQRYLLERAALPAKTQR